MFFSKFDFEIWYWHLGLSLEGTKFGLIIMDCYWNLFVRISHPHIFHRLDTTLIDFTDMKCQRGDLSFIFNGDAAPSESFVVLDNEQKVYQRIHHEVSISLNGF